MNAPLLDVYAVGEWLDSFTGDRAGLYFPGGLHG